MVLHFLGHQPYSPDLASSDYHLSRGLKIQLKNVIFRKTRRSFQPRKPGWTEKIPIFLVACKSYSKG